MPSNHLIPRCPLLLLPSISPSIRVFFQWVGVLIRWPKYWTFSISPSSEYSELISFRTNWFAMLAVQGTLKSLLQHHSSKASILQHSAFFIVQLSHPHMTTGKTIALTTRTFDYTELQYMFIITQHLNNTSQASWQLQSQPKRSKGERQPNLWKSPPLPQITQILLPLISLWNYLLYKNWQPHTLGPLSLSKMTHTLSVVNLSSLNKPFTLL